MNIDHGTEKQRYILGYSSRMIQELSRRRVTKEAAFFLPHLKPGMSLLDCGCGPGVMTVDLAAVVAPGPVVGIDLESSQFTVGEQRAQERDVSNIRFEVGNILDLAFPDNTFDAVFAHGVLYHLHDPGRAVAELHRVLKPGGIVGIRDLDGGALIIAPANPLLEQAQALINKVWLHQGANPFFGRNQRKVLREVGFACVEVSASFDCYATPEETQGLGNYLAELLLQPGIADLAIAQGWATRSEVVRMSSAWQNWGEDADAFLARGQCEAVGWKE